MEVYTKRLAILCTATLCFFFGSDPIIIKFVRALLILQTFDIITGLISLFYTKTKFNYRVFGDGILRKILILLSVSFGYYLDSYSLFGDIDVSFQMSFTSGFIIYEIFSIIQNFKKCNINLPLIDKYIKL